MKIVNNSLSHSIARIGLVVGVCQLACPVIAQAWGTYQGNVQHNGYVPIDVSAANISQLWQVQAPLQMPLSQVACGGGMLFVSTQPSNFFTDFTLYGLEAATGAIDWSYAWTDFDSLTPPALYDGKVYVQTIDNDEGCLLTCFYANGDFGWRQPFTSQWANYLAPTVDSGVAYIAGGEYGGMYAFGADDGSNEWFCNELMQYDAWTPSLDATYAYTYTGFDYSGTYQAGFYAVNRVTGNADYQIYDANYDWTGYTMGEAPAISGTMAYITNGGRLVAFDLKHRTLAWQTPRQCAGQPDAVGNVVYSADGNGISAFDATTGVFQWNWTPSSGAIVGPFVITNNLAFVSVATTAGGPATITCGVDLTTHQQVWSTSAVGAMSIGDGTLYIGGQTGLLTAISLSSLQLVEPTSYQLYRGVLISGTLASILSVDDASLKIGPGPTLNAQEAPAQVVVTGVSPSPAPTQLRFHLQASVGTPNLSQTIEMWNYTTSSWVVSGTVAASRSESVQEVSVSNPAQYLQPGTGQIQARLSWKQVGPTLLFLWPVSIDQAVWLEG